MIAKASLHYLFLCSTVLCAADFSTYRGFRFGATLEASAKHAGVDTADVRVTYKRPALIEELDYRLAYSNAAGETQTDPVREVRLRFHNGELFQMVITYDRQRVEGMTAADMIDAISNTYGPGTKLTAEIPYRTNYGVRAHVLARWEDKDYSCDLVRTGDQSSFAMVLSSKRLDTLAQAAILESARLDLLEAPQRAIDFRKQQDLESRKVQDKARSVNVPNFRP